MRGLRRRFQQRRRPVTGPLLRFVDKSQIDVLAPHDALQRRDHAKAINANGLFAALYRACVTGARLSATWTNASQCKRGNERDCSTSAGACTAMLRVLDDARVSSLLGSRGPRVALGFSCMHHISVSSHVHRAASSVRSSEKQPVSKYCLKLSSSSSSSSLASVSNPKKKPIARICLSSAPLSRLTNFARNGPAFSNFPVSVSDHSEKRRKFKVKTSNSIDNQNDQIQILKQNQQYENRNMPTLSPNSLFFLMRQPQAKQRKCYPNETRFLLPNPLILSANEPISHKLQYATANVELVNENGESINHDTRNGSFERHELLDGELMQVLDSDGFARFSIKCLITSEGKPFRLLFRLRYQLLGETRASFTFILSAPFIVTSNKRTLSLRNNIPTQIKPVITAVMPNHGNARQTTECMLSLLFYLISIIVFFIALVSFPSSLI